MYARTVITGLALSAVAAAVPVAQAPGHSAWGSWPHGAHSTPGSGSPTTSTVTLPSVPAPSTQPSVAPPLKSGNPFSFPLSNGFPNLSQAALNATEEQAGGTEPNGGAPTLTADDLTSFQLIAFNEIFEVAFFTDLLYNVTNNVAGFTVNDPNLRQIIINSLTSIQAVEELHADNANKILQANGLQPIQPCQYKFPSDTLESALAFAKTFTDLVIGTLQDIQLHLADNNDNAVVPIVGGVIGNEGEQTGFFRVFTGLTATELPFLTRATRDFAFSALNQNVVVPGSCPNSNLIKLEIFDTLTVVTTPTAKDQTLTFSVSASQVKAKPNTLSLVYINSQNVPIVEPLTNIQVSGGTITFSAYFPYSEYLLNGLTVAALTSSAGPFTDAEDVAKVTVAGPGLIEIN